MASKGKSKEKGKSPFPAAEAEQEIYIVPGKLSEKQWVYREAVLDALPDHTPYLIWRALLGCNEGVEIVADIVFEICDVAFSIVYSHYLEKQAFPQAISDAEASLLKVVEWQFLTCDREGKNRMSCPSWVEDEEPIPATIDSWARGAVPTASLTSLQSLINTTNPIIVQSSLKEEPDTSPSHVVMETPTEHVHTEDRESSKSSKRGTKSEESSLVIRSRPVARHPKARLVALQHPPGAQTTTLDAGGDKEEREVTPSLHSHTPTSSTEELSPVDQPLPYGMKPVQLTWQKEVSYDERGNIVSMVKLDPSKFPSNCVRPTVCLIKPHSKAPTLSRAKSHVHPSQNSPTHLTRPNLFCRRGDGLRGSEATAGTDRGSTRTHDGRRTESRRFPEMPALPPLVDTIDPMPGVTVREADRTVQGTRTHRSFTGPTTPQSNLRPVHPYRNPPRISAHDSRTKVKLTIPVSQEGGGGGEGNFELAPVISGDDRKIIVKV